MALRRTAMGQRFVDAGSETCADVPFEAHLPRLAVFCLRLTKDAEKAVLLAERVLLEARRKIASSRDVPSSALLFSVLREEWGRAARAEAPSSAHFSRFKSAPAWK